MVEFTVRGVAEMEWTLAEREKETWEIRWGAEMNEEWYLDRVREGELEIDEQGKIWKLMARKGYKGGYTTKKLCKAIRAEYKDSNKYLSLKYKENGECFRVMAHRLVWYYFYGKIPEDKEINHKNGIKDDNRPENLEIVSHGENIRHAIDVLKRNFGRGYARPLTKLTRKDIELIKIKIGMKGRQIRWKYTGRQLMEMLGVSEGTICTIRYRESWKCIDSRITT